jgi:hypothetical protein
MARGGGAGAVDHPPELSSAAGQVRSRAAWMRGWATVMSDDDSVMRLPAAPLRMDFRPAIAGIGSRATIQSVPCERMEDAS